MSPPPGSGWRSARLNIEELARTLGVSPTPVREALTRVEADGLIVKQPGRSYTVAPLMGIKQVESIELAANLQRLHFFDLATGQAIRDDG